MADLDSLVEVAVDFAGDLLCDLVGEKLPIKASKTHKGPNLKDGSAKTASQSRLVPEPLVPEKMTPEKLVPEGAPEGTSTEGNVSVSKISDKATVTHTEAASSAQYLLNICRQGLAGAMLSGEILGPPISRRRGRHGWNSRY